jgi:hypothetical protein
MCVISPMFHPGFNPTKLQFPLFSPIFAFKLSHFETKESDAISMKQQSLKAKKQKKVHFTKDFFGTIDS